MAYLVHSLVGLAVIAMVSGIPMIYKCPDDGSGQMFFSYEPDCEQFLQCYITGDQALAIPRYCHFGTYWNNETMSCDYRENVVCPATSSDKCANKPDGIDNRVDDRNCRGYWECRNGVSVPQCCPSGEWFDREIGVCVELTENDVPCNDTCLGDVYDISDNSTATNETDIDVNPIVVVVPCDLEAVPGKPGYYIQYIHGHPLERPCGSRTYFSEAQCACVAESQMPVCEPEIHLTFESGKAVDSANKGHYIQIVNAKDGIFNQSNSKIAIPRFNNIGDLSTVVVELKYKSDDGITGQRRAILSNDVCDGNPSMSITETDSEVEFTLGTNNGELNSLAVPRSSDNTTSIQYKFINNVFNGSVNGVSDSMVIDGSINSIYCDLTIGQAEGYENFRGEMEEIKIYLCEPESEDFLLLLSNL